MPKGHSVHFAFETIAEGVNAALSRPGGGALANSGIIDLGDDVLVFDTSLNPRAAVDLKSAAVRSVGRPPSIAANSHWHLDHILGNQEFSGLPIFGTRKTREILLLKHDELMAELSARALERDVRALERHIKRARSAADRRYLASVLQLNRQLLSVAPEIRLTPPNRTFERRVRLPGYRGARLLCFGSGHTASDAILELPLERIVFSGDLVVAGQHPNLASGNPEHWLTVLRKIEHLHPKQIVPGHGPVLSSDAIDVMEDYLTTILEVARSDRVPSIPPRFRSLTDPGQFNRNIEFLRNRSK